jgi:hypothetical protein
MLFFLFLLSLPLLSSGRHAAVSPNGIRLLAEGGRGKERVVVSPTRVMLCHATLAEGGPTRVMLCHATLAEGVGLPPATVSRLLNAVRDPCRKPNGSMRPKGDRGAVSRLLNAVRDPCRKLAEGGRGKERVAVGQLVAVSPTRVPIASA